MISSKAQRRQGFGRAIEKRFGLWPRLQVVARRRTRPCPTRRGSEFVWLWVRWCVKVRCVCGRKFCVLARPGVCTLHSTAAAWGYVETADDLSSSISRAVRSVKNFAQVAAVARCLKHSHTQSPSMNRDCWDQRGGSRRCAAGRQRNNNGPKRPRARTSTPLARRKQPGCRSAV